MNDATKKVLVAAVRKVGPPALHTFWQTFSGLLGVWWLSSGLDLAHAISDVDSAERFAVAAGAAAVAAAASATKTTVAVLVKLIPKVIDL